MPFTAIKGRFHVAGYSPDGDSIRFAPEDPALVRRFDARLNRRNHAQLRIEAIDALETHYTPEGGGGTYHQPLELAEQAQETLLAFLGFTGVEWDRRRSTVLRADQADGIPGHILARAADKFGRPVAFVFPGDPAEADGTDVFLDAARMRGSWNWAALRQGLAYPTYYSSLFAELRQEATAAVAAARAEEAGIWARDVTEAGFDASGVADLTQTHVILPKLFRRLLTYLVRTGGPDGFKAALEQSREPVLDLTGANFTHFDTFIEQPGDGARIRLTRAPEDLVFDPMIRRTADPFATALDLAEAESAAG